MKIIYVDWEAWRRSNEKSKKTGKFTTGPQLRPPQKCSAQLSLRFLALLVAGCGGAPFETAELAPASDAGVAYEASAEVTIEASVEASVEAGASQPEAEASLPEAGVQPESAPEASACLLSEKFSCGVFGNTVQWATPPDQYCFFQTDNGVHGWSPTTGGCNTCGTYNCACILPLLDCRKPTCDDSGGQVRVTCNG